MTRVRVRFLARAIADLTEIGEYLAIEAPDAKLRILDRLVATAASLAAHPQRGPIARDPILAARGFRSVRADRYVLFYKIVGRTLRVHRVLHERRSWAALLG